MENAVGVVRRRQGAKRGGLVGGGHALAQAGRDGNRVSDPVGVATPEAQALEPGVELGIRE